MDDYISKPVLLTELEAAINRAVKKVAAPEPAPAAPPDAGILDPVVVAGLRELREPGEPDPLAEVGGLFLQDTPPRLELLKAHLASGNLAAMESPAHSLKGSASNLGAHRLASLCASLEKFARNKNLAEAGPLLAQAVDEYQRVSEALTHEMQKQP